MKKIIFLALTFLLVVLSASVIASAATPNNGAFNQANGGCAVSDGEYVYHHLGEWGEIWKENIKTGETEIIYEYAYNLLVHNNYLYYYVDGSFYRMPLDGRYKSEYVTKGVHQATIDGIVSVSAQYCFPVIYNEQLYYKRYTNNGYNIELIRYDLDNFENPEVIGGNITDRSFAIMNNKIYFKNTDKSADSYGRLAQVDLNGNNFKSLNEVVDKIMGVYKNELYFTSGYYTKKLSESGAITKVVDSTYVNIYKDYIYFRDENGHLSRKSLLTGNIEESKMNVNKIFCIAEDTIYSEGHNDNIDDIIFKLNKAFPNTGGSKYGPTSTWAEEEVNEAGDNGLIPQTLIGKDLTKKVTRSEFAAIAVAIYKKLSGVDTNANTSPFTDISDDPNRKDIRKAYSLGITAGISATTFEPKTYITREQLATMFCRAIKKYKFPEWTLKTDNDYVIQKVSGKKYADDAEISDYAKESVYFMRDISVIKGVGDNKFVPKATVAYGDLGMATREQAIIMSNRIRKAQEFIDFL